MFRNACRQAGLALALMFTCKAVGATLLPPEIIQAPRDRTVSSGAWVTLRVAANGYPPLTYQWRRDGGPLIGANQEYLTLTASKWMAGAYDVVVTNVFGAVTSA